MIHHSFLILILFLKLCLCFHFHVLPSRQSVIFKRIPSSSRLSAQYTAQVLNSKIKRYLLDESTVGATSLVSIDVNQRQLTKYKPQEVIVTNNQTETLLRLISFGEQWSETKPERFVEQIDTLTPMNGYETVPGCMATVKIKVDLNNKDARTSTGGVEHSSRQVSVNGMADSRVSLGMLAFIANEFEGKSLQEALNYCEMILNHEITPRNVSAINHVRELKKLLPVGRLNGFDNMVKVIQQKLAIYSSVQASNHSGKTSFKSVINLHQVNKELDSRSDEIAVLLSGGVDSSVALAELIQQGHKARAYYLKIWLEDEIAHLNQCPWEEDLSYATAVCQQLQVPLETLSLQKEYWQYVVSYTLQEAKQGRTPNPDIMCNSRIKFGMFYDYVGKYHKRIATGHYAQTIDMHDSDNGFTESLKHTLINKWGYDKHHFLSTAGSMKVLLRQSPDPIKDQSYFLCALSQNQLQRCIFPIGHLQKDEVRRLASESACNLPTKHRKDSQGICFLGKLKFDDFIHHYLGEQCGEICDFATGEQLGEHKGLWFHTLGQRKGLGNLLTNKCIHRGPWFVAGKDIENNKLVVTNDLNVIELPRLTFTVKKKDVNWLLGEVPLALLQQQLPLLNNSLRGIKIRLKLRHSPTMYDAIVTCDDVKKDSFRIALDKKDKGIAPGQFAAMYEGDVCIGSAVIDTVG